MADYGTGYIGTSIAYTQGAYLTGPVSRVAPEVKGVLMKAMRELLK
jgi:multidrug resistance efflux pump